MFGHSMGGFAAGESVREGLLQPKLVIAAGADARTGEHGPPLLLLVGQFDEFFKPSELKTRTDAPTIVSPWSNHGFELFDPLLVNAAVKAACAAVGKPHPPASTTWCWNVAGVFLALLGAGALALALPPFPPRWSWAHGAFVAAIIAGACFLTFHDWLDLRPHPRGVPWQIIASIIAVVLLIGARKLRIPRWAFLVLAVAIAIAAVLATNTLLIQTHIPLFRILRISLIVAPALFFATIVGMIASFRGLKLSGDVAMALIIGCGLFQLGNAPRTAPEPEVTHHFIKLDPKSMDACAGQYHFPPDNFFRIGADMKIWR